VSKEDEMKPYAAGGRHDAGFTLVELLIVVGMVAVLLSILSLGVRRAMESFELRRAASTTVAEIRNAQAAALANHVDYVVEFGTAATGGPPGSITVYRRGLAVTAPVSVRSDNGDDKRSVTVVGIRVGEGLVSDTVFLQGTTSVGNIDLDWLLQADTPQPNSCCTISIRQGGTPLATIASSAASADIAAWTPTRTVRVPDWPRQVRMDPGGPSPMPACSDLGAPWLASTSRCLRFRVLGYPDQEGELFLCNAAGGARRIRVAAGTGRISDDPGVACP
jgi:prepilin-type N-terminal cleavage/methylation domain-containing protein